METEDFLTGFVRAIGDQNQLIGQQLQLLQEVKANVSGLPTKRFANTVAAIAVAALALAIVAVVIAVAR